MPANAEIFGIETTDFIFWALFVLLTIGEILVVYIYKLPKENVIRDWVEPAFEAIIIAIVIRTLVIQAFRIPTSSMEDNLMIGDHIIANKFVYGTYLPWKDDSVMRLRDPKRGDVIIFRYPVDPKYMFIKRCMGLPGDVLEMKDKVLYINGKKMDEKYTFHKDMRIFPANMQPRDNWGPITVPPDNYFAMGDNRDLSADSRYWGFLKRKYLRGKAWLVYWPPTHWKIIKHEKIDVPPPPAAETAPAVPAAKSK
jgi:signal peptidase I